MLYFAYGSNLDEAQMRSRCPSARADARAVLSDHALTFGGFSLQWSGAVATVARAKGSHVHGLLYCIDETDLRALDRFEGHPFAYQRITKVVLDEHGQRRRAQVYRLPEEGFEAWCPQQSYFTLLWRAYERLGFDVAPLMRAVGVKR